MNIVEIIVTAKNLTGPAFTEAKAGASAMESSMAKLNKTANLSALALAGVGFEAVKMATKFDSEMQLLVTQAGVGEEKLGGLKKGVLDIAAKVGTDPDSLAEALFHVESNFESMGITSAQALKLTETAAKGAAVGHADLVDVTNALTAAVASGIPGVQNLDQAMGVLNATVGVGDMKMQDLAKAFGSGMVATVKGFGLSITDVGAALAVFGDNNIRGSLAGNQLRMSVMALAKPIASSGAALKELGLTQETLANDMQAGGLKLALEDLVQHMQKAGISADQQGQVITEAFGRKAGAGLNILVGQLDRLESKYPALEAGANGFGQAWERTSQTFSQQTKQLEGSLQALMITLGEKMLPPLQKAATYMLNNRDTMVEVAKGAGILLGVLAGFSVLSKIAAGVKTVSTAFEAASVAMAAYKVRVIEAQVASVAAGNGVRTLSTAFGALSTGSKIAVSATAIGLLVTGLIELEKAMKKAPPDVDKLTSSLVSFSSTGTVAGELSKSFGDKLQNLGNAIDPVVRKSGGLKGFFENVIGANDLGPDSAVTKAKDQLDSLDKALAGLVASGHADEAAGALKKLEDAVSAQGGDPKKLADSMHKYQDALAAAAETTGTAADVTGSFTDKMSEAAQTSNALTLSVQSLKDEIIDFNDVERSEIDTQGAFEAAMDTATKALHDNGQALQMRNGHLDLSTEKARTEASALTDLAKKTDDAATAALNNGESVDYVNGIYAQGRDKLISLAKAMGLNTDEARQLAEQILQTPDKTANLKLDIQDMQSKLAEAESELKHAKGEKTIELKAQIQQLLDDIRYAQNEINLMHGRTLPIVVSVQRGNARNNGGDAHGGIIGGAATGGVRSSLTWVGENGPELVSLPAGSTVHSNPDSRRMAAGMGGAPAQVHVTFQPSGNSVVDALFELLRQNIRIQGGNVQTVLGQN